MAKVRVFIGSTHEDLRHVRSWLEKFVESLGYEPILSESGRIAYRPDVPLDRSCYIAVESADIFVLIIGGRYGSEAAGASPSHRRQFSERYTSITHEEYRTAVSANLPIYVLVDRMVFAEFQTFGRNRENPTVTYAHVDSINVFELIEDVLSRSLPVFQFDRPDDIEKWLREQWSGLFHEILRGISTREQLASLAEQVAAMTQVNATLKNYVEQMFRHIAPTRSSEVIETELARLAEENLRRAVKRNLLGQTLLVLCGVPLEEIRHIIQSKSVDEFVAQLTKKGYGEVERRAPIWLERARATTEEEFRDLQTIFTTYASLPAAET
jgi:Domain of unknown function (DUF4062)